jgi:hypothetical protein
VAGFANCTAHIFGSYRVGIWKFNVVRSTGKSLAAKKVEVAKRKDSIYLCLEQV